MWTVENRARYDRSQLRYPIYGSLKTGSKPARNAAPTQDGGTHSYQVLGGRKTIARYCATSAFPPTLAARGT